MKKEMSWKMQGGNSLHQYDEQVEILLREITNRKENVIYKLSEWKKKYG